MVSLRERGGGGEGRVVCAHVWGKKRVRDTHRAQEQERVKSRVFMCVCCVCVCEREREIEGERERAVRKK